MSEQNELEDYFNKNFTNMGSKISFVSEETFRKEKNVLLKILLPWRDFEKERPPEKVDLIVYDGLSFVDAKFHGKYFVCDEGISFDAKYWMYRKELEATLPKEDNDSSN